MREHLINVGRVDDFRDGRGKTVDVNGVSVAVYRVEGRWYALKDACPHMGASLGEGQLNGRAVVCHWHGWEFDLESGRPNRPSKKRATTYRVEVHDGQVWVESAQAAPDPTDDDWVAFDPDRHLKK